MTAATAAAAADSGCFDIALPGAKFDNAERRNNKPGLYVVLRRHRWDKSFWQRLPYSVYDANYVLYIRR